MPMSHLERSPLEVNKKLTITGVVQGVGFRPFVYQLANRYHLHGYILNSTSGVSVEVEGDEEHIKEFLAALQSQLPPLARIDVLKVEAGDYFDTPIKQMNAVDAFSGNIVNCFAVRCPLQASFGCTILS